jgi:hypothetical protein
LIGKFPDIYAITAGNPLHQKVDGFFRRFYATDDVAVGRQTIVGKSGGMVTDHFQVEPEHLIECYL